MIIAILYIALAIYIIKNVHKVNTHHAQLEHITTPTTFINTKPIKDSHWYTKTFLRNRKRKAERK